MQRDTDNMLPSEIKFTLQIWNKLFVILNARI